MRIRLGMTAIVGAIFALAAPAQTVSYQHKRGIFFPIPTERLNNLNPRPTKIRLWTAAPGQKWRMARELAIDDLDQQTGTGRRGFAFTAGDDGDYEFATQQVFPDGGESPRESQLRPDFRVIFDSKPPTVTAAAVGTTGIEWDLRDEFPETDSVVIEARYKDTNQQWVAVKKNQRNTDRFTWSSIPAGYVLEVRVVGKDKAGNEGRSQIITLPTTAGVIADRGRRNDDASPRAGSTSYGDDFPNRPEIQYVNELDFRVESKLTRVTKSGIGKVVLFVRDEKTGWREVIKQDTAITMADKDPMVKVPFKATADGLYEFRVLPVSNAELERGDKIISPGKSDPAQIMVEVDTVNPEVTIRNVKVTAGSGGLPRVDIEYLAKDRNLIVENPVTLEWSSNKSNWNIITRTKRDGVFTWENIPETEWKVFIRARAQDKASNEGTGEWAQPVVIDLDRPEATIERIERSGGKPPSGNETRTIPGQAPAGSPASPSGGSLIAIPGLTPGGNK